MRAIYGFGAAALLVATGAQAQIAPLMSVTVTPERIDAEKQTGDMLVEMTVPVGAAASGETLFTINTTLPGLSAPQVVRQLKASDASGALPLVESGREVKSWAASRAVKGPVKLSYRMALQSAPMLKGGPPTAPRIDGNAFSGIGQMLWLQPEMKDPVRVDFNWDLSKMAKGSEAVTSFGDGDFDLPAGPAQRLSNAVYMVGPVWREPEKGDRDGFSSVWADDPGFDAHEAMRWTGDLHSWMSRYFGDDRSQPYRVFMRFNPMNAGGGSEHYHSFIITYGKNITGESIKSILGHEMVHTWTANGIGKWYSEGDAVYYQALLAWRAGLISTDAYLADVNETASRYYTNLRRDATEKEANERFWEDTRVRVLPYDRGAMYFAKLDGMIRRASGGKRSVDDLVLDMVHRDKSGQPVSTELWDEQVAKEVGDAGKALREAMMRGDLIVPESSDFGPCFRRTTKMIRRFDVGFDFSTLVADPKLVTGLKPDSEAAKAGIRNGDVINYGLAVDSLQGDVNRTFTVDVTRDGKTFPITYLPRGEAVEAYQWERVPGVPESRCKLPWPGQGAAK